MFYHSPIPLCFSWDDIKVIMLQIYNMFLMLFNILRYVLALVIVSLHYLKYIKYIA